jgi:hypothetical protein
MLPIYRQLDGDGAVGKNAAVFKTTSNVLNFGRNLLIFGEGFTDDVFIRRLKPIKKGPARIGFIALEAMNWEKKVYVSIIGINYGQPNYLGGDVVIANSERFCLNDYYVVYKENPNKAITEVTRRIEAMLKPLITHVENKDWAEFHEQVMRIRRDGLHPENTDLSIPLKKRYENSKRLATWINQQDLENEELIDLVDDILRAVSSILQSHQVMMENSLAAHGIDHNQAAIQRKRNEIELLRTKNQKAQHAIKRKKDLEQLRKKNEPNK